LALPAWPYAFPLSEDVVREAYFFGGSQDQLAVAKFPALYKRTYEPDHELPAVSQIEFRTPYAQVVLRSKDRQTVGYSAQQAQLDFAAHRHEILVRVSLLRTMQPGEPDDFWRQFQIEVKQKEVIEPLSAETRATFGRRNSRPSGAEISLLFDAEAFAPQETSVAVVAPDGRIVVARFALDRLK
jgi:hypothetical protein